MAKNVWINRINEKGLHKRTTSEGREFFNVSFPCSKSVTGFATLAVNPKQIIPATDKDGKAVDGYVNVLVGGETGKHKVSICTAAKTETTDAVYENVEMTNVEIAEACKAARKAYRAAAKAAETETAAE